jgi:biopolymer transport protein ExbD
MKKVITVVLAFVVLVPFVLAQVELEMPQQKQKQFKKEFRQQQKQLGKRLGNILKSAQDDSPAFYWTTPAPYVVTIDPENGIFENQTPLSFYAVYPELNYDATPVRKQGCNIYTPNDLSSLYLVTKTPCGGDQDNPRDLQYIFPNVDADRIIFTNGKPPPAGAALYNTPQGEAWVLLPGIYKILLLCGSDFQNFNDCPGLNELEFEVRYGQAETGVNTVAAAEDIRVYPNPAGEVVNIETGGKDAQVIIIDMSGKEVYRKSSAEGAHNIGNLSTGNYVVTVIFKDVKKATKKIMKK